MKISEIKPEKQSIDVNANLFYVSGSRETIPKSKEVLKLIVDSPCLKACEYLYDCNIRTCNSSANCQDVNSYGYITIDYKTLDDQNKQIYHQLVQKGFIENQTLEMKENMILVNLKVPITMDTDVEEFSNQMYKIAHCFQPQEILYGRFSEEEMNQIALQSLNARNLEGIPLWKIILEKMQRGEIPTNENGELQIGNFSFSLSYFTQELAEVRGYYFDEPTKEYWLNLEFYERHNKQKNR